MKTRKLIQSLAAVTIAVSFASGAFAMGNDPLGTSAQGALAARVVKLDAGSNYLNVQRNETVTIVRSANAFTWRFDTLGAPSFELAKIAPQGFDAGHVRVYVAEVSKD